MITMIQSKSNKNMLPGYTAITSLYNAEAIYGMVRDNVSTVTLIVPALPCCDNCCKTLRDCYEQQWYDPPSLCYKYFGRGCQMCLSHCMPCRIDDF
jgi:hypothetical protein